MEITWSEKEREKEKEPLDSYFLRQTGIPGYGSVNVDTSPRILHLESGIRGWRGKSLLPANLARKTRQEKRELDSNGYVKFLMEL